MNRNQERRDEILGIKGERFFGGCETINHLTLKQLEQLIEEDFIELEECQNDSPTINDFYNLMKQHPEVCAHGYAVEVKRRDYRITLEGLRYTGLVSPQLAAAFTKLCRHADEFELDENYLYSWWD